MFEGNFHEDREQGAGVLRTTDGDDYSGNIYIYYSGNSTLMTIAVIISTRVGPAP